MTERLSAEFKLEEYQHDNKIFFKDIDPDNLYFYFNKGYLSFLIVCGSGKKWRAERLRNHLLQKGNSFKSILMSLHSRLRMDVYLHINSYFRLSRFRTAWLANIRGPHRFPVHYDRFYETFTNPEINSFTQMTKEKINAIFKDEIKDNNPELDSQGLFPKWEDSESFLQYCYFDINIAIPEDQLIAKSREDLVDMFRNLFGEIRTTMLELSHI